MPVHQKLVVSLGVGLRNAEVMSARLVRDVTKLKFQNVLLKAAVALKHPNPSVDRIPTAPHLAVLATELIKARVTVARLVVQRSVVERLVNLDAKAAVTLLRRSQPRKGATRSANCVRP